MAGLLTHFKRILTLSTRPSDVLSINPTQIHSLNLNNALRVAAGPNRFRDQVIVDSGAHHGETLRRLAHSFHKPKFTALNHFHKYLACYKEWLPNWAERLVLIRSVFPMRTVRKSFTLIPAPQPIHCCLCSRMHHKFGN